MVTARLDLNAAGQPCDVIHNPMDFDSLGTIPEIDPSLEEKKSLLFVGRIEPRKGVKELIDAACLVMRDDPEVTVHLVGKDCSAGEVPGSMVDFLKTRIPSDLMPRFFFEGLRPREEVLKRYGTATACVFPAPWDNFPYTCCEAMAYHACVVASDHGGTAEMIEDGTSGLLFPAGDVGALADRIRRVLSNPDLRRELRKNAGPRIRDVCSPEKAVRVRIDHYQKAIDRHRKRGKILVPAEPLKSKKLAALIPNMESEAGVRQSIDSVQRAARKAHLDLDLRLVGSKHNAPLKNAPSGATLELIESDSIDAFLYHWLDFLRSAEPDFLFRMRPGETLDPTYFAKTGQALEIESNVGWATTWLESVDDRPQRPFVGFDFSVPLEMIYYHAVPYCVMRYQAFRDVGGVRFDLPLGWRDWDLFLALQEAGWQGKVVPDWQGRYIPWWGNELCTIDHPKAQELVLERIVRRSPQIFRDHGCWLWVSLISNQSARKAEREAMNQTGENGHNAPNSPSENASAPKKSNGFVHTTIRRLRRLLP
jgi:hypothetical protein